MTELPAYSVLCDVPRERILGLLCAYGEPAWAATNDYEWQRIRDTWQAVERALADAAGGRRDVGDIASPPSWLPRIVSTELRRMSTSDAGRGGFHRIRLVERLGLIAPEHDDTYVLAFVSGYGEPDATEYADRLREDRDLLDDLFWRCFEVEGGGEVSLANVDRWRGDQWRRTVLELVATEDLQRERVLTACLAALTRDFAAYRVAWFLGTYLALEPTDEEKAAHQQQLRTMLRSAVPATVTAAVRLLADVVDRLDRQTDPGRARTRGRGAHQVHGTRCPEACRHARTGGRRDGPRGGPARAGPPARGCAALRRPTADRLGRAGDGRLRRRPHRSQPARGARAGPHPRTTDRSATDGACPGRLRVGGCA